MSAPARLSIALLSIFPELCAHYVDGSLLGRARREGLIAIDVFDLREGATDAHRSVDDAPFGGGAGMVFSPVPIFGAVEAANVPRPLYLMSPTGRRFDQAMARELASLGQFSLLCARYEGVDERIVEHLVDGEVSLGDFVLAGGELAALAITEAVARLVPGVMGNAASPEEESFSAGLLEYPHYTRPASFRGWSVPEVLLSGDHGAIARWRQAAALARTMARRPDLIAARGGLTPGEARLLAEHGYRVHPAEADVPGETRNGPRSKTS